MTDHAHSSATPAPVSRTHIKICGLTREQDVEAATRAGVDALGFVLYPQSPRCVSPQRAAALTRDLPAFVTPVLLFVNASAQDIAQACDCVPGALLQFHGDESPQACASAARAHGRRFIRAARMPVGPATRAFDLVKYAQDYSEAQAILLDAHVAGYGGAGQTFNWSQLPPFVDAHLVLSGGLDAANVTEGLTRLRSRGRSLAVDVSSGVELEGPGHKGIKDALKIQQFVRAVQAADRQFLESAP